jgi:hypothetical protein
MKKKIFVLLVSTALLLTQRTGYARSSVAPHPSETAVLILPNHRNSNWNEISRIVTDQEGMVERIPFYQTSKNWSQLICVQYVSISKNNENIMTSIENILDALREEMVSSYPEHITWKILEKNKNDILYEWILQKHDDIPTEHEIARGFLTKTGFHRVGFTRKNAEMSPAEREKWIKLLKESTSVVSYQQAINISKGFSLVDLESPSR